MMEKTIEQLNANLLDTLNNVSKATNPISKKPMVMDLSDVGNEIGIIVQQLIQDNEDKDGFDMNSFMSGFKHGVSLIDGTH